MEDKPQSYDGYEVHQTAHCKRLLASLFRAIGPWKDSLTVIGGLVPTLLFSDSDHVGTQDVDLVLDPQALSSVDAYKNLETNLKTLGLKRNINEYGEAQHFRWKREKPGEPPAIVEFLCPDQGNPGKVISLKESRQKGLSALGIPGAHLVFKDYEIIKITADLLDERGKATVEVRVASIVSFIVLKALAYEQRMEHKDAYDLIFTLINHPDGPQGVGKLFAQKCISQPEEPLYQKSLAILAERFLSEPTIEGIEKDGPISYATFVAPDDLSEQAVERQNAVSVILAFTQAASRFLEISGD